MKRFTVPDKPEFPDDPGLPGVPLRTGFETGRICGVKLSAEATQRVLDKMASVARARALAAREAHSSWMG